MFLLRLMKPSDLFTFEIILLIEIILLMWVLKFMLVYKSTPADTLSRVSLCIVYEVLMGTLALVSQYVVQ